MLRCIRENTPCIPAWWTDFVLQRAVVILVGSILLTVVLATYTISNFKIDTDFADMVSAKLPFRQALTQFRRAFPQLKDSLLLVVDAETPEKARHVRNLLANHLRRESEVFRSVTVPKGDEFFEQNGLLYLEPEELVDLADNLAKIQPFMGLLVQELSLKRLFTSLTDVLEAKDDILETDRLNLLLANIDHTLRKARNGESDWISWQDIMQGESRDSSLREFIILWPYLDYTALNPIKAASNHIKAAKAAVVRAGFEDVSIRVTGNLALRVENLISVRQGIGLAAAASIGMVILLLSFGLRSARLVVISLITLLVGLIWTLGFTMAAVGRLNIISVTFVVLFIGLGIDYSIQYCLRYKELIRAGSAHAHAIRHTTGETGNALLLCTVTTAIGFYAFVPTSYTGASELGLISGTGMFINYFVNMTVLPALLHVWQPTFSTDCAPCPSFKTAITSLPNRFPKTVIVFTTVLFLGGVALLPRVYFDYNPLNLNNPRSESVLTAKELFADPETSPWTISILLDSDADAKRLAERLEKLPVVEKTLTLSDLVPRMQEEKIQLINDMALFMPPVPQELRIVTHPTDETLKALGAFGDALADFLKNNPGDLPAAQPLLECIEKVLDQAHHSKAVEPIINQLETALLVPLKTLLTQLAQLMQPETFDASQLPPELKANYVSQGHHRLQVFPRENLSDLKAIERFVIAVQQVDPLATGTPVAIVGAGHAISLAFLQAFIIAVVAITVLLALVTRRTLEVLLILIPLLISLGLTAGTMVLLSIPFNFANIIVVPLLLGIGVDYAIHLIYRFRVEPMTHDNILQTSTARGVLFSALTTIVSFGSLSLSAHQGTASMGIMLTVCITIMIGSVLVLLPALLHLFYQQLLRDETAERR
jgi:hopanoid biosynthesis associated RND transporter like protein HpnN